MTAATRWLSFALILLAVWLPFGATLSQERIGDDFILIESRLGPEHVHSPLQLWSENYWGSFDNCGLYRPLSLSLLYAQRQLFGLQTVPYRIVSLLLYSLCGILCFLYLRQLIPAAAATAAALLFVLHPAHVEVILAAYGQVEMLSATLVLAALLAHVRAVRANSWPWSAAAALLFLAAMLSKEVAVSFPVLAVLTTGLWLRADEHGWRRWAAPRDAVYLAVLALYAAVKYAAIGVLAVPPVASTMASFSLSRRLSVIFTHGLGNYLRLTLFPASQSMVNDVFPSVAGDALWLGVAAIFLALCLQLLGRRPVHYAAAWFAATWFIFSNLAVPTGVFVAERCLFLPVLALCLLFGLLSQRVHIAVPAIVLALAGAQAFNTAQQWHNEESALRAAVAEHPTSPLARSSLALRIYAQPGAQPEAQSLLTDVLRDYPQFPEAHRGLGLLAKTRGDYRAAVSHFERGLALRPRDQLIQRELSECRRLTANGT